ncbi:unnamed protein product [Toxocara canis]|uniref:Transposase n=1 Tax=Toxocara canis TaxID=6265 RepID=A0A183U424_TOXCA|nr:unnamed protein product [Toxocara canis]
MPKLKRKNSDQNPKEKRGEKRTLSKAIFPISVAVMLTSHNNVRYGSLLGTFPKHGEILQADLPINAVEQLLLSTG